MSEVTVLNDISEQIKMAEIFSEELEKSNVQEGNSHEFEKALSKQDWVRFNSAIAN